MRVLRPIDRLDRRFHRLVTGLGAPVLDPYTPKFVQATDNMAPWFLISATMAATGGPRARRTALRAMIAAAGANAISAGVKHLTDRPRPDVSGVPRSRLPYRDYGSSSFPSGHTAAAVGYAAGIAADAPRPLAALVAVLAGTVAVSRVHSGVHYPGDVLGGALIGLGASLAARAMVPPRPELTHGATTLPEDVHHPGEAGGEALATGALPGTGVTVVCNPRSADVLPAAVAEGATVSNAMGTPSRIARALPGATIVSLSEDDDIVEVMDRAAKAGEVLAVAGGDGTVNAGARAAIDNDRPLLVIPDGTLNNFARTLGLTSVDVALRAFSDGRLARVDVGEVDGHLFLNTASFGSYPRMVERRDRWAPRIGKWPAFAWALWHDLREVAPTPAVVDGRPTKVWWAFVGNCRYRTHARVPALRESLVDGRLDVRVLGARSPFPRLRAVRDVLFGRHQRGEGYRERTARELVLTLPEEPRLLAVDGEVMEASRTVRFTKRPAALRVFVPRTERP
ncbi:phosphatase PAP2 family protein [Nocardiopsis sp. N85]|uniref:bifunctional phosphatase PAP2/diacylglycerol kinase family protein n=1 Tax=Nocardiopsis sp. N85 TaxID=3029400 RepID=UPI00237F2808|nr:bifunctional phosphatase PAP2/diacylglycerol kinase family protein [Nocardiopsis sp. N85]MDE3720422.1 phosphatase PAP2 family protein [Nocardiopsis sp. N85]